jgi:hypothetical protein
MLAGDIPIDHACLPIAESLLGQATAANCF